MSPYWKYIITENISPYWLNLICLYICFVMCIIMVRAIVVFCATRKALKVIEVLADKAHEEGDLCYDRHYLKIYDFRSFHAMVFDLWKWKMEQFFPEVHKP